MTTDAPEVTKARYPFRLKLGLLSALVATSPVLLAGWLLVDINANAVETLSYEVQLSVADDLGRTVESELRSAEDALATLGRLLIEARLPEEDAIDFALSTLGGSGSLDHAGVYDAEGRLVDTLRRGDASTGLPDVLDVELRTTATRENVATGPVSRGASGPRVLLVVPMRLEEGGVGGFMASRTSLAPVQARVERLAEVRFRELPNALYLVDDARRIIAHPDPEQADAMVSMGEHEPLSSLSGGAIRNGLLQSGQYTAPDGTPMVGSLVGLEHRPWAVVVQVPREMAYESLEEMRRWVVVTVLGAALLALLAALGMARQLTRPLERLVAFATDLAARRFDRRVAVETHDELGVLGHAMSRAAADLEESEAQIRHEIEIRTDLGRYLPVELVEKVVLREQDMALGGVRQEVTVLFADVVAFTPLVERLAPEEVVAILNELFTILTEIVFRHGGTIDKFVGDCVMALWGAPEPAGDHAERALAAAEDMLRWLEAGNAHWSERYGVVVELAVGVSSGEAVVGNIGSESRMEYTAIGDVVNLASRLEAIARPGQILCTAATRMAAGDHFEFVDRGVRVLTGRNEPIQLFEVRL